jgi:hypothetical protein
MSLQCCELCLPVLDSPHPSIYVVLLADGALLLLPLRSPWKRILFTENVEEIMMSVFSSDTLEYVMKFVRAIN